MFHPRHHLFGGGNTVKQPSERIIARTSEAVGEDPATDAEEPLTEAEVARWLKISRQWLAKARSVGNGPPYVWLGRGLVRYRRKDVIGWLEKHKVRNTAAYSHRLPRRSPGRPKRTAGEDRQRPEGGSK